MNKLKNQFENIFVKLPLPQLPHIDLEVGRVEHSLHRLTQKMIFRLNKEKEEEKEKTAKASQVLFKTA